MTIKSRIQPFSPQFGFKDMELVQLSIQDPLPCFSSAAFASPPHQGPHYF